MECKKSNKIRDIVRLQQILKKWRRQATSSSSKTKDSIKFFKRTLSNSSSTSSSSSYNNNNNVVPKKGYLAVSVGEELKRFIIPTEYLGHPAFHILLREAEEEFGFQQSGVLRIPCEVGFFETILRLVEDKIQVNEHFRLLFGINYDSSSSAAINNSSSPLCSSSSSQHQAPNNSHHHPQSPMCR